MRSRAGAVAFVRNVKNPVKLARLVMENTGHVLLAGEGANQFAVEMSASNWHDDEYFFTEHRWLQLQKASADGTVATGPRRKTSSKPLSKAAIARADLSAPSEPSPATIRQPRRGHFDRRNDEQEIRSSRRYAADRLGHLRR